MLEFLTKWEPVWLLVVLVAELIYSIKIHTMAKIEFDYDKEWNERVAARRKRLKPKVEGVATDTLPKNDATNQPKI